MDVLKSLNTMAWLVFLKSKVYSPQPISLDKEIVFMILHIKIFIYLCLLITKSLMALSAFIRTIQKHIEYFVRPCIFIEF